MKFISTDINETNTWQIGTGDPSRSYISVFLKFGVALVGPGEPGPERDPGTIIYYAHNRSIYNWGKVLTMVKKDEWIIAKKGVQEILAIGQVVAEYDYSNTFADVDGWDLQHFIKVKWYRPIDGPIVFSNKPLMQSTLNACLKPSVFEEIYKHEFEQVQPLFDVGGARYYDPSTSLDILDPLINKGVRIQDAENIVRAIARIIRLTSWYKENDSDTLEAEIVTFLVVPLLISLGWSEQKIKIEYNNIDIAIFKTPFDGDYSAQPRMILEVKKFDNGLAFTDKQILKYGDKYPGCKQYVTTNGFFNLFRYMEINPVYKGDDLFTATQTIMKISNLIN